MLYGLKLFQALLTTPHSISKFNCQQICAILTMSLHLRHCWIGCRSTGLSHYVCSSKVSMNPEQDIVATPRASGFEIHYLFDAVSAVMVVFSLSNCVLN